LNLRAPNAPLKPPSLLFAPKPSNSSVSDPTGLTHTKKGVRGDTAAKISNLIQHGEEADVMDMLLLVEGCHALTGIKVTSIENRRSSMKSESYARRREVSERSEASAKVANAPGVF